MSNTRFADSFTSMDAWSSWVLACRNCMSSADSLVLLLHPPMAQIWVASLHTALTALSHSLLVDNNCGATGVWSAVHDEPWHHWPIRGPHWHHWPIRRLDCDHRPMRREAHVMSVPVPGSIQHHVSQARVHASHTPGPCLQRVPAWSVKTGVSSLPVWRFTVSW